MPYTNYTPKAVYGEQINATQEIKRSENTKDDPLLGQIEELDKSLIEYFPDTLVVDNALTRKLVSFQANKARTYYRWYKYKEAFFRGFGGISFP